MPTARALLRYAGSYVRSHPEELVRALRNVVARRVGLPIDGLVWLAAQAKGKKAPKDVTIEAVPPGIRLGATVNLMKTPVRVSATIFVDGVRLNASRLRFEVRLSDVALDVLGECDTPLAQFIRSGSLDLRKPGNLVALIPKRPPALIEARDDRLVIDLMQDHRLARRVGRIAALVTPLVNVRSIETDAGHLDIYLSWFPDGVAEALVGLRSAR